ncbi:hypothetical protein [Streptomyces sp. Wb2n-11]|uniref:hypothetical protein n=1 Tax=Streptomyces sp. Wb2n-11 TaxID=1030533 RepID=UPI000B2F2BCA|nr:hypothetical protein [Streptomyces sp. Wb2n-11]
MITGYVVQYDREPTPLPPLSQPDLRDPKDAPVAVEASPSPPWAARRRVGRAGRRRVGAGVWAVDSLGDADRTAPTVVWAEPADSADRTEGEGAAKQPEGLAASLLPVPYSYELGPDIDDYGNDSSLTRRQAVAVFKEGSRGLPSAQRNKRNKAVDKLKLQGIAMRGYRASDGGLVSRPGSPE